MSAMSSNFKRRNILLLAGLFATILGLLLFAFLRDNSTIATKQQLFQAHNQGRVVDNTLLKTEGFYYFSTDQGQYRILQSLFKPSELSTFKVVTNRAEPFNSFVIMVAVLILLMVLGVFLCDKLFNKPFKGTTEKQPVDSTIFSTSSSSMNYNQPQKSTVKFSDVVGIEEVKEELFEIIDFLKQPRKYINFGARLPKGTLLVGPPGVGKTLVAKAVAGEAHANFYYHSGASFNEIYVGVGAKKVRELFLQAKKNAPAIIFIDEIDAVGKARGNGSNNEREATLNQLLTEMDGFLSNSAVVVLAATNKIEVLDEALLRSGRFDRRVFLGLPNKIERQKIIEKYLEKTPHDVDFEMVSAACMGLSSATLATLCNESILYTLKSGRKKVSTATMLLIKDKVVAGKKRIVVYTDAEKEILALYQSAKIITAYTFGIEFEKVGILSENFNFDHPRILSKTALLNRLKLFLSGMVICDLTYGEHFTFVQEDLLQAKFIASKMAQQYAMAEKIEQQDSSHLILDAKSKIRTLLVQKEAEISKVKTALLKNEYLTKVDLIEIF